MRRRAALAGLVVLGLLITAGPRRARAQAPAALPASAAPEAVLQAPGLSQPVEIRRDRWGVNHIYAASEADVFFAQGYAAARDRLFQFEMWRRQATGTVAEILGPRELERDRGASRKRLRRHLQSQACRERISRLAATLGDRRFVTGRRDAGGILARRLRKRWKRLQRALEARSEDPEALHELRLAAKHARYASEALMPLLGIEDGKAFKALKRLQDCLGEHRDATEALAWLANLGEPLGPVLLGRLEDPIERVRLRRLRELDRLAARFTIPRLAPRAATPGRRRAAGRSARSSVPPRRRSPSS